MSFGRTAARDGNQVRFLPAAQLALPARPRPVVDGGFESLIDEPSPRSGDSEGAYRNRLSRLAVRQPFVSFQQRKGPLYRAGQRLARRDTSIRSDRWDGVSSTLYFMAGISGYGLLGRSYPSLLSLTYYINTSWNQY